MAAQVFRKIFWTNAWPAAAVAEGGHPSLRGGAASVGGSLERACGRGHAKHERNIVLEGGHAGEDQGHGSVRILPRHKEGAKLPARSDELTHRPGEHRRHPSWRKIGCRSCVPDQDAGANGLFPIIPDSHHHLGILTLEFLESLGIGHIQGESVAQRFRRQIDAQRDVLDGSTDRKLKKSVRKCACAARAQTTEDGGKEQRERSALEAARRYPIPFHTSSAAFKSFAGNVSAMPGKADHIHGKSQMHRAQQRGIPPCDRQFLKKTGAELVRRGSLRKIVSKMGRLRSGDGWILRGQLTGRWRRVGLRSRRG